MNRPLKKETAKVEKPIKEEQYTTDPKIDLKTGGEKVLVNSIWVSKSEA